MAEEAENRGVVLGFVLRLVADKTLAEDLTQDVFLKAERSAGKFRGDAEKTTWLCTIALNLVRDHFRAQARRPGTTSDPGVLENLPDSKNAERDLLKGEMSSCIARFMSELPKRQYEALALFDIAGQGYDEIAAALDVTEANARVLVHRARSGLQDILKQNCALSFDQDIPCEEKAKI
jgi:RNA polymerase sigma-70 factor, ECF subfamily